MTLGGRVSFKPVAHDAFIRAGFAVGRRAGCRAGFPPGNLGHTAFFELSLKAASTVCASPSQQGPHPGRQI